MNHKSISLMLATAMLFAAAPSAFAATPVTWYVDANVSGGTGDGLSLENATTTIQAAVAAASPGDTINVAAGTYALDSQIRITKGLTIVGAGDSTVITTGGSSWTNSTGSKGYAPLITISGVSDPVVLQDLKVTGAKNIAMTGPGAGKTDYGHGINVVSSSNVTLNNVTSTSNAAAGLIVNSSNVTADNLNTSGNGWYSVNVDQQDSGAASFTLTGSGVLGDNIQIDSDKTTGSTVTADGYASYKQADGPATLWTNKSLSSLSGVISITKGGTSTLYATIPGAVAAAADGDTVNVGAGTYKLSAQLNVSNPISIVGNGSVTIQANNAAWSNSSKHLIDVTASTGTTTLENLTFDSNNQAYGLQFYTAPGALNGITIENSKGAGLTVNGSTVTATNLNTSGNFWGAVNVDPGAGVTDSTVFTLNSGTLAEGNQIWSDGSNNGTNPVGTNYGTVNAPASYKPYVIAGGIHSGFKVWSNGTPTGATIEGDATNTLYSTIQAAINAASTTVPDTITIGPGTYTEQLSISKGLNLSGAGEGSTIIQAPSVLTTDAFGQKVVLEIGNGASVTASGLTIKGPGPSGCNSINYGIFVVGGAQANLHDNAVENIADSPLSGCQNGVAIRVGSLALSQTGTATIQANTVSGYQKGGIVIDGTGSSATVSNNTVSGVGVTPSIAQNGIQVSRGATATVSNNEITGNYCTFTSAGDDCLADPVSSPNTSDGSAGILLYQAGAVTVAGNTLSGNQLQIASFDSPSITVSGNSVTAPGSGSPTIGIAVWYTSPDVTSGTITGNAVDGHKYGIFLYDFAATPTDSELAVHGNKITTNTMQLWSNASTTDAVQNWWGNASSTVFASSIVGNVGHTPWYLNPERTVLSGATGTVDSSSGDFTVVGSGGTASLPDGVTGLTLGDDGVLDLSGATTTGSGAPVTIGGSTVTLAQAVTLQSGVDTEPVVLANANLSGVTASIPDGTTIQGPVEWDGTIAAPTAIAMTGTVPAGFSVAGTAITVGSSAGTLVFDNPVTITLTGVTGAVGYKPAGSDTWTQITTACDGSGTYDNPTPPAYPGECFVSNGTDTKIVTYHFTTYGGLTISAPVISPNGAVSHGATTVTIDSVSGTSVHYTTDSTTPTCSSTEYTAPLSLSVAVLKAVRCDSIGNASAVSSATFSQAGGGGGGGGGGSIAATPATPANPAVSPAVPATPATPAQGQVLGAAGFKFSGDLTMGSSGDEVTELQKRLISEGFDIPAITSGGQSYGYFGGQTLAAVIAYQKAHGIFPTKGFVGAITRAELNKAVAGVVSGKTNLTTEQATAILNLLTTFGADADVIAKVKAALGQ